MNEQLQRSLRMQNLDPLMNMTTTPKQCCDARPSRFRYRAITACLCALALTTRSHAQTALEAPFTEITDSPVVAESSMWTIPAWGDYDNDGWPDLFVGTYDGSARNALFHNERDGTFSKVTTDPLVTDLSPIVLGAAWADYDNDGFLDVCVTYGALFNAQRNALFRNNGNYNSWIKLRCVGTDSNRPAIGTKVRVKARIDGVDRWQMRQIGCDPINSLDVVIGLRDTSFIDTLRIEWPSGRVQEFHNVAAKQTLTLVERTNLSIASRGTDEIELLLSGPRQQRYRVETSTNLRVWSSVASLTITNADGTAGYTHASNEPVLWFRAQPE
jgi:hypothetical protein